MIETIPIPTQVEVKALAEIWLSVNLDAHDFIPEAYWLENLAAVKEHFERAEFIVFKEQEKIIGFLGLQGDYIAGLFVLSAYRRQGIGQKLLKTAQVQHTELQLTVFKKNKGAVTFYEREGFEICSETEDQELGELEYTMSWSAVKKPQA